MCALFHQTHSRRKNAFFLRKHTNVCECVYLFVPEINFFHSDLLLVGTAKEQQTFTVFHFCYIL